MTDILNAEKAFAIAQEEQGDVAANGWTTEFGEEGKFRKVLISQLKVDGSYARNQSKRKAQGIARDLNWAAFGALVLSERADGSFFVLDGNHRALAAHLRGDIKRVPCLVFSGLSRKQEAAVFVRVNTSRRSPMGTEIFVANLVAGDPEAKAMKKVLDAHGLSISRPGEPRGAKCLRAVSTAYRLKDALGPVLDFIDAVWPENGEPKSGTMSGVHVFAKRLLDQLHIGLDAPEVVEHFSACPIAVLDKHARARIELDGMTVGSAFACALVHEWNKGRRSHRIRLNGNGKA